MPFIACKLPHGLRIQHQGKEILLVGGNIGEDLENVSRNGRPNDNEMRAHGFGLTEVSAADADVFEDWRNKVTYNEGAKEKGKLAHPFPALENGSILGPFKTKDEARKEAASLASSVSTGFEGLDPDAEKIEENTDANSGKSNRK